ncbi:MAG TPA: hypothetical protein VFP65_16700 [Anaeromyxobacteraceae bacterium]|nr:hypothetical protein [Anaeromyxobacteraceae bacterium]
MPVRKLAALIAATPLVLACAAHGSAAASRGPVCPAPGTTLGCWEQLRPVGSGGFPAEPGSNDRPLWAPGKIPVTLFPVVGFGGDLWMVSQTHAYASRDGLAWTQHDKEDWGARIAQSFAFFRGRLWMLGGLDYRTKRALGDVWWSADGVHWQPSGAAGWPAREGAALFVFKGKLWLLGGTAEVNAHFEAVHMLNDVWSSEDGLHWTQVTSAAPWRARAEPRVAVLGDDALYLLGGGAAADVWRSEDGVHWTQLTAEAPWTARHGYGGQAFDGRLWVFGGWVGPSTNALDDVWWSMDGASWTRLAEHAPWAPRSPRWVVFRDRLWIYSGKHTGAADSWGGDVWTMLPVHAAGAPP